MKLLKTQTHVDNLNELRRRKAEVKARLDREQVELRADWQELRSELKPGRLMASFAKSLLSPSESGSSGPGGIGSVLQGPLRMATDLLVGNARMRVLLKVLTPLVLTYLPRFSQKIGSMSFQKSKANLYGTLRKGVSGLRSQLNRKKTEAPSSENTDESV